MEPEQIAARVWPGRELVVEPLGGGITNHNFKITTHGETFVLRIGGKDTALLGIDREASTQRPSSPPTSGLAPK